MKYLSKESAIEGVRKIFENSDGQSVLLDEIYAAWNRQDYNPILNLRWLGNKLTHWKYHNLVRPIYKLRNGKRTLGGVQLTLHGKQLVDNAGLGQTENPTGSEEEQKKSLLEVMKLVENLKRQNPNYEITFDIKLKNK